ncbi:hypothetical protein OEB99_10675 [Actinotalea sp. M2MS4P-6]|uniref:hypothetical protein n=1 Tax=Actinotalea sp. M2MS4P-6 TaxID=2983762 RepID=UPI0021E3C2B7|nr:hypothetical protein [Actinotalea sp. M2MS4P-6]MCV2394772.1 hypothetical protein [Actinotalea sp. M2MS4P-6]
MPTIETSRSQFRRLIAANPNHFGTFSGAATVTDLLPVVEPKSSDTGYEEIGCVAYSPERSRLEATVVVKRSFGYGGDPCQDGSVEWVRFFVDTGSGWVDAGASAARVFDVPDGTDCADRPDHPYVAVVGVDWAPARRVCSLPQLPRVRAILSWEHEPTPGDPNYVPVWGEVAEDHVQVAPRRWLVAGDLVDVLAPALTIDPEKLAQIVAGLDLPVPIPEPDPVGPVALNPQPLPPVATVPPIALDRLARMYAPEKVKALAARATDRKVAKLAAEPVPPHRFAASLAADAVALPLPQTAAAATAVSAAALGIDLGDLVATLSEGKGNTTYEELECLGLDDAAKQLVATFRVKRPTGFSGPPCSAGSTEYVAFWADFDDDCRYRYLGTVKVSAHDFITMPAGGLSYAAVLPVDLDAYRRLCEEPGLHRVRAVLSWNSPPSTTDPDAVPHWGNRLDTHVHVLPGHGYDGTARLTIVGGVATDEIDPVTGITRPVAHIAYNGAVLDPRGCPFAGRVTAHGPTDPALAGSTYRLLRRDLTTAGPAIPVAEPFYVVDSTGHGSWLTPPANGWMSWPVWSGNTLGTLGYMTPGGDDRWEVMLELQGAGVVDTQVFQLDNTLNAASTDPANAAHLAVDPGQLSAQACGKFTQGMAIHGTFDATDAWFAQWWFELLPTSLPVGALTPSASGTTPAPVGSTWTLDTSALTPCGYVLRLRSSDRAVISSTHTGRSVAVDVGFCIE